MVRPWPYRAAPLLIVVGLGVQLLPIRKRWSDWLATGPYRRRDVARSGVGLGTVRQPHRMRPTTCRGPCPTCWPALPPCWALTPRPTVRRVVMHSMRQVHRLAATWELLLDPATFLFFIGGLTMLALRRNDECGMMNDECQTNTPVVGCEEPIHHSSFFIHHFPDWSAWIGGLQDTDVMILCMAAAAGRPADGPVCAPRVAIGSRPAATRDEPFFFAVDAVVAAGRAGAVGMAIRAFSRRVHEGRGDEGEGDERCCG